MPHFIGVQVKTYSIRKEEKKIFEREKERFDYYFFFFQDVNVLKEGPKEIL